MIRIDNLVHKYSYWESDTEKSERTALDGVSFDIPSGQFLAILGPNGCGKSTLAKHLNVLLLPSEGTVWIDGKNTADMEVLWKIREEVGMVFQNPDNQIVGTTVEEDIAFGPENRNVPSEEIRSRVSYSLDAVSLSHKRTASPNHLSGGQKQRVAIAGTIVGGTSAIVLDEPTAMLDPNSRRDVMKLVLELNKQYGITIILITHHTDEAALADSVVVMKDGKLLDRGTPAEIFSKPELLKKAKMNQPHVTALAESLKQAGMPIDTPVLAEDVLVDRLCELLRGKKADFSGMEKQAKEAGELLMEVDNISYCYGKGTVNACSVLEGISLDIHAGECIGIIGVSGCGKTTLVKHLNGLLKANSGDIRYHGESIYKKKYNITGLRKEVGMVFQYPEHQLFGSTVMKDVCFGPLNLGFTQEEAEAASRDALRLVDIPEEYENSNPLEMSGGQRRRVALAGVLAMNPKIMILDEPTVGLDPETKEMIFELLLKIRRERNVAMILVSHHMEDVAEYADRVLVLDKGKILIQGSPEEVFMEGEKLRSIGVGIPQVTAITQQLIESGIVLPHPAVTHQQAQNMILSLWNGQEGGAV